MFGNLFNEEDSASPGRALKVSALNNPAPPSPRLECKLAGIDNQGATCYLNSLLQTLFLTPEFREKLFSLTEKELGVLQDKDEPKTKMRVIPFQLQRLFAQLLLNNQQSVSTTDLTNSFGWTNQEGFQQHDVQELNRILFSAIEDSLIGTKGEKIINELYRGTIVNQTKCLRCKKVSEREEEFLDLTLSVAGVSGLEAILKQCYLDVEVMDGRNQYQCEMCGTYTDATKGAKLRTLPPILTLSLLRFSYDLVKMSRYKENSRFAFPFHLDMSAYSEQNESNANDCQYDLFSVVVHRGGAYGGHYFAYIRDIDNLGLWAFPDDKSKQTKADPSATGLDIIECESPLDLIENILSQAPHHAMSADKLCAEISKVTGVSWNKRFKKAYGPINKFLKSNDLFDYNTDSNWVSLEVSAKREPAVNGSDAQCPIGRSDADRQNTQFPNNEKKDEASVPDDGPHWFCFNDNRVCPITTKEIERQFSGKESAYMLFYRKSTLDRPAEAIGQAAYQIPQRFMDEVSDINASLQKKREEYELTVNCIKLKIYQPCHVTYTELIHVNASDSGLPQFHEIEIDRRKGISELRSKIREFLDPDEFHNFIIHQMRECCGGYHLYEEIKDEEKTLQEAGLTSELSLLVWNGSVLDDQFVDTGQKYEPIKLLVLSQTNQDIVSEVVMSKSKSLHKLKCAVAEVTGQDCNTFTLQKAFQQANELSSEALQQLSDLDKTLDEAGLTNDEVIVLITDGNDTPQPIQNETVTTTVNDMPTVEEEPTWSITLKDRLRDSNSGYSCKTIEMKVRPGLSVKEFKSLGLELLQIYDMSQETVRLREDHKTLGLQPPLRESLSIQDSGLCIGTTVIIESGRPPQDSEMTISVNKMLSGKLTSKKEFLVDRQLTVLGMLQAACRLMNCEGTDWFLSKTDVYGDPADCLDDNSATLLDFLINDGDTLILQQGTVVRKDQVCLDIWLASGKERRSSVSKGTGDCNGPQCNGQDEEDKVMLELAAKLSTSTKVEVKDLNPLNDCLCPALERLFDNSLVVSKSMSIDDLKQGLMETERFKMLTLPTCNFMRLRSVESNRLQNVLRSSSQMLRHANPKDTLNVVVQILPYEETLGIHEILLNVTQKIGGSRIYMPAKEFIWNTSGGQGAADLKKAVATRYSFPLHDVLLSKYNPETFQWLVLKDAPQKPTKAKGKKKGGGKTNIRQAPYFVQDGDVIGVKIISLDKGFFDLEDFSTQEDIEKRLQLLQLIEEKKRQREEKKNQHWMDGLPTTRQRRPEVPLTIKVDKFS